VKVKLVEIAAPFRTELKEKIDTTMGGKGPTLVGFLANNDPAAEQYADWTQRACEIDGINYETRRVEEEELEHKLKEANEDPSVHGIMIYYPVFGAHPSFFGGSMDEYLRDCISPEKDVEGLCHTYRMNLYRNIRFMDREKKKKCVLPCTALSVVKILEHLHVYENSLPFGNRMVGKTITIINRSEVVGRPLAAMLANDGALVYSVDIDSIFAFMRGHLSKTSETPESACKKSQVIICGVPSKNYKLDSSWVSPGTVVVNVASFKNVNEDEILQIPGVKYVPLVGKVTVAMLQRNLMRLYENFHVSSAAAAAEEKENSEEAAAVVSASKKQKVAATV